PAAAWNTAPSRASHRAAAQGGTAFRGGSRKSAAARTWRASKSATARYGRRYQTLFAHGTDSSTGQNVGAILDTSGGWGVYGRPSRVSDLERELSKHLVLRLTNAVTSMDICVVHLRRPIGADSVAKQRNQ